MTEKLWKETKMSLRKSIPSRKMKVGWGLYIIDETITAEMKTFHVFPLRNGPSSKRELHISN